MPKAQNIARGCVRFWIKEPHSSEKRLSHPNDNLYVTLSQGFPADKEQVAIETPDKDYSWADIDALSAQYAHALTSLKLNEKARDRKSTRLNSSHVAISYAVFCLKKNTMIRHI